MPSRVVSRAMDDPDTWVLRLRYEGKDGEVTDRIVSPIRYVGSGSFLALCLCREEPRMFYLSQCKAFRLIPVHEVLMPVEIKTHKRGSNDHKSKQPADSGNQAREAPTHREVQPRQHQ